MTLCRINTLEPSRKTAHKGPVAGGCFLAHRDVNDLPRDRVEHADLPELLRRGTLWVQDAEKPGTWQQVASKDSLPKFKIFMDEDYEACRSVKSALPYMPEFYWVPANSWRARRIFRRLTTGWRKADF